MTDTEVQKKEEKISKFVNKKKIILLNLNFMTLLKTIKSVSLYSSNNQFVTEGLTFK